jgi:hypothetical protein
VVEKYPLYSKADEGYYLLGQSYEAQIARVRNMPVGKPGDETAKANFIKQFTKEAAGAYSHIVERYPVGLRAEDAKARLEELHQAVPTPTHEAIAQNKKEMESREATGMMGQFLENFRRRPNMAQASKVGDPTLVDPKIISATEVAQATVRAMTPAAATGPSEATSSNVARRLMVRRRPGWPTALTGALMVMLPLQQANRAPARERKDPIPMGSNARAASHSALRSRRVSLPAVI